MRKLKRFLASLAIGSLVLSHAGITALADGQSVVSLGVDLSEEQRNAILKYFGIEGQNIPIIWVNNQQERDLLSSYVPLEQIGTHTYSCAYIQPTMSGGIQVRTANMNWVTSNMIATTLSTAGVVNCNVVAVAPFEMSGTGALTGILLAYETSYGQQLDPTKKEIATQELITTGTVSDVLGKEDGTKLVNDIKIQIIQGGVTDEDDVIEIVDDTINKVDTNSALSDADRQLLQDLANQIAQQQYNYDEVKDTLQRVEQNVGSTVVNNVTNNTTNNTTNTTNNIDNSVTNTDNSVTNNTTNNYADPNNIINNVDESALGENVISDSTNEGMNNTADPTTNNVAEQPIENTTQPVENTNQPAETPVESPIETPIETPSDTQIQMSENTVENTNPAAESPIETPIETPNENPAEGLVNLNTGNVDNTITNSTEDTTTLDNSNENKADGGDLENTVTDPTQTPSSEQAEGLTPSTENAPVDNTQTGNEEGYEVAFANSENITGYTRIFINKDNVVPQSGTITATDESGATLWQVDLSDMNRWVASLMSDEDKTTLGWTEGTELLVFTGEDASLSGRTVKLDATVVDSNGTQHSILGEEEYAPLEYVINLKLASRNDLASGNTISGTVLSDGTLAQVASSILDPSIASLNVQSMDLSAGSATFTLTLSKAGRTSANLVLYSQDGSYLGELNLFAGALR